jgi:transketolase
VAVGGGLAYGAQGYTHHAIEDLAVMLALPNMTVIAPGDSVEARLATRAIVDWPGPCYLRLGRAGERIVHQTEPEFQIGKAIVLQQGSDVTLISTGGVLATAVQVGNLLKAKGVSARILSMHTIKPCDCESILQGANETPLFVTIEEHAIAGGLGSVVAKAIVEMSAMYNRKPILLSFGISPKFVTSVGTQDFLKRLHRLDAISIAQQIINVLERGNS